MSGVYSRLPAAAGVRLVLSGHLHQSYFGLAETYHPGIGESMVVAHSGTTTSSRGRGCERGRNTGFWIEIGGGELRLVGLEWQPDVAEFVDRATCSFPA